MKSYVHHIITPLLLSIIRSHIVESQVVKISTNSATFTVSVTAEQCRTFSTNESFQYESAMSALLHTVLSTYASDSDAAKSRVIATSVHIERMRNRDKVKNKNEDDAASDGGVVDETSSPALTLRSVVSVTSSDVGLLYNALTVSSGLEEDSAQETVASILTKSVKESDILKVFQHVSEDLVTDDTSVLELSFTEHSGQDAVTSTNTEIQMSGNANDGWPMFWAGTMFTLLFVGIGSVCSWVYKKEYGHWPFMKGGNDDDGSCNSVHYEGDVDLEVATTASGVLGLKGCHPHAEVENDENSHPNSSVYRRRSNRGLSTGTGGTTPTSKASYVKGLASPTSRSHMSGNSSKYPVGITSMKKLSSMSSPKKQSSTDLVPFNMKNSQAS